MLIDLRLSQKCPRNILYARKSILGVELIVPNTIIAIFKSKLYIRNIRRRRNTLILIEFQEEYLK